ncbi:MAG: fibronectin type III-like domain-contianing protein, partial [Clostridia bacterium]|nr:fibronectin type III-like domain-contianing protein [Clostridia bacterium]
RLSFTLSLKDFSFVNREEKRVVEKGEFEMMVGGSSLDKDLLKTTVYMASDIRL